MTVPPEAIAAISRAVVEYEPKAMSAIIANPKQLLSVLLEVANRSVYAAAPLITAAERDRIRQTITAVADQIDRMTGHLAPDDRMVITETLRQVAEDLDKFAAPQPAEAP